MEILAELTQEIGLTAVLLLGAGIYFYRMSISDRQDRRDAERFNKEQTILFTEAVSDFKTVIHENNGIMGANQDIVVHNQLILEQNQKVLSEYAEELKSMRKDINDVSHKVDTIQTIVLMRDSQPKEVRNG